MDLEVIFFSADHHFCHLNIIRYCQRPFQTVEEMNEEMVRRWNTVVMPEDTVFYLGDFSLAKSAVGLFATRLNGEKYLIMGNHDACHPCHKKKALPAQQVYLDAGFKSLELERTLEIADRQVLLNHMPYLSGEESSEYKIRHKDFRPAERDQWLLHGHIHEKWKSKEKMINVGVDVWDFFPVPITEIEKMIRGASPNS